MQDTYFGTIIFFNNKNGWGFIQWNQKDEPQKDMFVHFSDISMSGFKTLKKDQRVQFKIGENNSGKPKAIEVTLVD